MARYDLQRAAAATGNGNELDVDRVETAGLQIVISDTATVVLEGTIDGANWVEVEGSPVGGGAAATSFTADALVRVDVRPLRKLRARISAHTAGTVTVQAQTF